MSVAFPQVEMEPVYGVSHTPEKSATLTLVSVSRAMTCGGTPPVNSSDPSSEVR